VAVCAALKCTPYMGTLAAEWRTCLRCGWGWLGAVVGRHAAGRNGRCASNGGFLNGRARRLGPFSTTGVCRMQAFVHHGSSHSHCALL